MAPVLGGVLYEKTGFKGVFGVGAGMLGLDLLMRLFVVEKKTAALYDPSLAKTHEEPLEADERAQPQNGTQQRDQNGDAAPQEDDPLLPKARNENNCNDGDSDEEYVIKGEPGRLIRSFPVLYCFRNPRLAMGLSLAFVQAMLLAMFDATIPTEADSTLGFSSLEAGLLFAALDVPYLILGPVAGWAVDRFGTKPAATAGFGYLVAALVLLRLPSEGFTASWTRHSVTILYCGMLALNGVGLAIIGSPSIVEASDVVRRYDKANPGFFGSQGPYAQLYGFNSVFFCAGLTIGPLLAGALRDAVGYGDMNLAFAIISGFTAVCSFFIVGGRPKSTFPPPKK